MRFPEGAERVARACAESYPQARARAAAWLGLPATGTVALHLVEDHGALERVIGGRAPRWAVAVTRGDDVLALRLDRVGSSPETSLETVLRHEAVHEVLNGLAHERLPAWFEEGLCVTFAGSPYLRVDSSVERRAAGDALPSFAALDAAFQGDDAAGAAFAYEAGRAAAAFFLARHGHDALRALLGRLAAGERFAEAFRAATGGGVAEFEGAWRASVTPRLPFTLYVVLENLDLALLFLGGLLLAAGFLRYRLRRRRALRALGTGSEPEERGEEGG